MGIAHPSKMRGSLFCPGGKSEVRLQMPGILLSRCVTMLRSLSLSVPRCSHFWDGVNSPVEEPGEERAPFGYLASLGLDFKMLSVPPPQRSLPGLREAG